MDGDSEPRRVMAAIQGKGRTQADTPAADLMRVIATIRHPEVMAAIHGVIADPAAFDAAVENIVPMSEELVAAIASAHWQRLDVDLGFAADPTGTNRRPT